MRHGERRGLWTGFVVIVVVAVGAAAAIVLLKDDEPPGPGPEVAAYLRAWSAGDFVAMAAMVAGPPPDFVPQHEARRDELNVITAAYSPGLVDHEGDRGSSTFRAQLFLRGLGEWSYDGRIELARQNDRWLVQWSPATIHPELAAGQRFDRRRTRPDRAAILGADDQPLTSTGDVVSIGVQPGRVADREEVATAFRDVLGIDPARLDAELDQPDVQPDDFLPIVDVSRARLEEVRADLEPIPGVFFRRQAAAGQAVTGSTAIHLLGTTREATAEQLAHLGPLYQPGDAVGTGGLEGAHEPRLAGTPSGEVRIVDAEGRPVRTVHTFAGSPPDGPLRTTLDLTVQAAAEVALDGVTGPAAIVAVDGETGAIRAAASRPVTDSFNRAFVGLYPPGSTFKVVTTAGLLAAGTTPSTPVGCPATTNVGGRQFRNFEDQAIGDTTFANAFAKSCNTAFANLAQQLGAEEIKRAATRFGFEASYDVGLPSVGGRFPDPKDATETAAAGIGQARVVASPLHMATIPAAVATGSWQPPHLVRPDDDGTAQSQSLSDVAPTLQQLMRAVVREGTGTAAAVAGEDIGGKTGTAEFGAGAEPPTHAWFIGFRGTLGFAVVVEGGGVGGEVAAPIAGRFVTALAQ